ncbi:MAG: YlbF family regulator [Phycisphaerae bacterium]|nr:YlbF family regulator [Phycisphaerae bacterium]
MEDIIAHARELGKRIAAHPRCVDFMTAARAVAEDRDAQVILKAYQEHVRKVQELQASNKPIEVEDKHKLAECEAQVAGNEKLKAMMKHQANYVEMMNRINHAMDEAVQNT